MRRLSTLFLAVFLAGSYLQCAKVEEGNAGSSEDLDALYHNLLEHHREPFAVIDKASFDSLYRQLKTDFPDQSKTEQTMSLLRLAASLQDGHTRVTLPVPDEFGLGQAHSSTQPPIDTSLIMRPLPLRWYDFEEGLAVYQVIPGYEQYIGWTLESISGIAAKECMERMALYAHADNDQGIRQVSPFLLSFGDVLAATGLAGQGNRVRVTLADPTGGIHLVELPFLSRHSQQSWYTPDKWPRSPYLLSDTSYYAYWQIDQDLYIRMDQMNNQPTDLGLIDFMGQLDTLITSENPDRVILDLRCNSGGDNSYAAAWTNLVRKHHSLNHPWVVLTGRKTFSAAQMLLNDLSRWTSVIFLGEPTGSRPSHFGDANKMILPVSGLTLRVSQIYWRNHSGNEQAEAFMPDVTELSTLTSFREGRDDVVAAARNLEIPTDPVEWFEFMHERGGLSSATRAYIHLASDWTTSPEVIQEVEKKLVEWME
jgi:hypothetical protein